MSSSPEPASPLTVAETAYRFVVQATVTFVMFAVPIVPVPFVTVQVCVGVAG
jgi:hypothetical protein